MRAQQGQLGRGEAGRVPPGRVSPPRPGQARVPPPAGSCACPPGQCHQAGSQERRPRGGRVGAAGDRAAAGLLAGRPDGRGQPELRLLRHQPLLPARGPRGRRPPLRPHHAAAALPRRRVPPHRLPRLPGKALCLLGAGPGRREPGRGPSEDGCPRGWQVAARRPGRDRSGVLAVPARRLQDAFLGSTEATMPWGPQLGRPLVHWPGSGQLRHAVTSPQEAHWCHGDRPVARQQPPQSFVTPRAPRCSGCSWGGGAHCEPGRSGGAARRGEARTHCGSLGAGSEVFRTERGEGQAGGRGAVRAPDRPQGRGGLREPGRIARCSHLQSRRG